MIDFGEKKPHKIDSNRVVLLKLRDQVNYITDFNFPNHYMLINMHCTSPCSPSKCPNGYDLPFLLTLLTL